MVWAGFFNFLGVVASSGAVAFGIISLLPVELILQVGSGAGFAMVFALLIAAIIWNLGTWYLGLPASSSHTLIGSIIGVGVANALMHGQDGTSGVDWTKATEIGYALLLSPLFGFVAAALLFLALKFVVRNPALYQAPKGNQPPPWWIRGTAHPTCTGVSFAHGSNDGQKGMGLIMLILIGTVPTAYALNRAMPASQMEEFRHDFGRPRQPSFEQKAEGYNIIGDPRPAVSGYVSRRTINEGTYPSLSVLIQDIARAGQSEYGSLAKVPAAAVGNTRNDMYLASEAIRFLMKDKENDLSKDEVATLTAYKKSLDSATKFIPLWVKVAVAIALGLGTMVGWKRIVITVGEKIGKSPYDLRPGRLRRTGGRRNDRRRRCVRAAGVDHARVVVRCRRNDGCQRLGTAMVHGAQPADGMGADAARGDHPFGQPLRLVLEHLLRFGGVATAATSCRMVSSSCVVG